MKLLDQRVGWGASSFYLSGFSLAGEEAEPGEGTKGRVKGLADPLRHRDGGRPQLLKTSSWLPWGGVAQAGRLRSHQQRCEEISKWCCCFSARRRLLPGPRASPSPGAAEVLAAGSLSVCLSASRSPWLQCCGARGSSSSRDGAPFLVFLLLELTRCRLFQLAVKGEGAGAFLKGFPAPNLNKMLGNEVQSFCLPMMFLKGSRSCSASSSRCSWTSTQSGQWLRRR